jgi:hypothetical protein
MFDANELRKQFRQFGKTPEMSSMKDQWNTMCSNFFKWRNKEEKNRQKEDARKAKELASSMS